MSASSHSPVFTLADSDDSSPGMFPIIARVTRGMLRLAALAKRAQERESLSHRLASRRRTGTLDAVLRALHGLSRTRDALTVCKALRMACVPF